MENKKDWTVPDTDGNINIPDRLDNLLNRIGFQLRLVTISGLNEIECLARMVKGADEHSRKEAIKFSIFCNDNYIDNGKREEYKLWQSITSEDVYTTEELYEIYSQMTEAVAAKNKVA